MNPKIKIAALGLSTALAGLGVGRAMAPSSAAPTLRRVCVEADGSAQVYTEGDGRRRQLLVPTNHGQAIMRREGGKVADSVPPSLSAAIKTIVDEGGKLASQAD